MTGSYDAKLDDDRVVIDVVATSSASVGGIAPDEVTGYACIQLSGTIEAPREVKRTDIECPELMREKAFDGDGYVLVQVPRPSWLISRKPREPRWCSLTRRRGHPVARRTASWRQRRDGASQFSRHNYLC